MTAIEGKPLRIWHVDITSNTARVDGIATAVDELAQWQRKLGHDVAVVNQMPGRLHGTRPDIVHLHSVFRPAHAKLAYRLRQAGIPYVTSPHSGLAPAALRRDALRKRAYLALCEKGLLTHAAAVICLTRTEAEEVHAVAGSAVRLTVIPNIAPMIDDGYPQWTPPSERPNLVCLSRFDVWQKGLDRLAAMAAWLPDVGITVYGAPDHNQPERLRQLQDSAPPNFHFAQPVHGSEKAKILTSASMYIQISRWEGLSMSVIEAMSAGVPCAVSSYIARSMDLSDGTTALPLCDTAAHAATQIRSILRDRSRLDTMRLAARDFVGSSYAGSVVAGISIDAYRAAIGQTRHTNSYSARIDQRRGSDALHRTLR